MQYMLAATLRCSVLFVLFSFPLLSFAATLSFSGSTGTVGSTISVPILVSTEGGESLNAISLNIAFPTDTLTLTSVSKSPSVISLWAQEPVYSNANGTAALEGIVPNPGFSGSGGRVATLLFTVKRAGSATISFTTASVLANDGKGTNILDDALSQTFTLSSGTGAAGTVSVTTPELTFSSAFPITSSTHPDQTHWYKETKGTFSWTMPAGATATRLLFDRSPSSVPTKVYDTPVASKTIEGIPEGTSYLHVQHLVNGVWGGIGRYRVQIDTTPPRAFHITFPHGETGINPQPIILFNTIDDDSGIERYEVKVGDGGPLRTAASADSNPYTLPVQEPGSHTVLVTAYDQAGNVTTSTTSFYVEGIDPPEITYYEERIKFKDLVKVRGVTYPNASVEIYIRKEEEIVFVEPAKSNSLGDFGSILTKRLEPGTYLLTARVIDVRGARSVESEAVTFRIEGGFITDIGFFIRDHIAVSLLIFVVLAACVFIHLYGWRRLLHLTHGIHTEHREATEIVHKAFSILKKDVASHMRDIRQAGKQRVLTKEELAFLEEFEGELDEAEAVVENEVKEARKK